MSSAPLPIVSSDRVNQLRVKVAASASGFDHGAVIPVFHRWIRERRLGGRLFIDVADYRHVPRGPGVMLIGHDGHLAVETGSATDGGLGLGVSYARKRDAPGPIGDKLAEVLAVVLEACELLADEPELTGSGLRVDPLDLELVVVNRLLLAPASAEAGEQAYRALAPAIAQTLAAAYLGAEGPVEASDAVSLSPLAASGGAFGVRARVRVADIAPAPLAAVRERLSRAA